MRRAQFERLVARALDDVPPEFAARLSNVAVIVEARPSPDVARNLGGDILGLYHGVSEMEQSPMAPYGLPEIVIIYQHNIEAICRTDDDIIDEIRKTVIHEIGHHFGLSDAQMEAWE